MRKLIPDHLHEDAVRQFAFEEVDYAVDLKHKAVSLTEEGLAKMEACGAVLTSTEMALFELLGRAGTPEFKEIQALVK